MSEQTRVSHPMYNLLPTEIEGFDSMAELALNLRWSWNHAPCNSSAPARRILPDQAGQATIREWMHFIC